ncbi:MAG TPA: response regulator [Bryobacteraceae bacterium]|jgi:DNA-binding NtrC family response regulator
MGKRVPNETAPAVFHLLSVSPADADHDYWERMVARPEWSGSTAVHWKVRRRATLKSALAAMRGGRVPIVICDSDAAPGTWIAMLDQIAPLDEAPYLIVTSRTADERLWAEALNRGAYDVLAKPFDREEVDRVVTAAWLRWTHRHDAPAPFSSLRSAS